MRFETLAAMAAGAFAYYMYRRVNDLEDVVVALASDGGVVHLGKSELDRADGSGHNEDAEFRFGFQPDK